MTPKFALSAIVAAAATLVASPMRSLAEDEKSVEVWISARVVTNRGSDPEDVKKRVLIGLDQLIELQGTIGRLEFTEPTGAAYVTESITPGSGIATLPGADRPFWFWRDQNSLFSASAKHPGGTALDLKPILQAISIDHVDAPDGYTMRPGKHQIEVTVGE